MINLMRGLRSKETWSTGKAQKLALKAFLAVCVFSLFAFKGGEPKTLQQNEKGVIYLTFDGCPTGGSAQLNDIVISENIPATVFITGEFAIASEKMIASVRLYKDNYLIDCCNYGFANRCYDYKHFYDDPMVTLEDFSFNEYLLSLDNRICRLPKENVWKIAERSLVKRKGIRLTTEYLALFGYSLYGWDVEWNYNADKEVPDQSKAEIIETIQTAFKKNKTFSRGHLVLACNEEMLAKEPLKADFISAIKTLKLQGYEFAFLSTYPSGAVAQHSTKNSAIVKN